MDTRPVETVRASDWKALCRVTLDRAHEAAKRLGLRKGGRSAAEPGPLTPDDPEYPQSELKGTVTVVGDIVGPVVPEPETAGLTRPIALLDATEASPANQTIRGTDGTGASEPVQPSPGKRGTRRTVPLPPGASAAADSAHNTSD